MQNDYYKILGVSRYATPEQIKQAYRIKAKLYHPDINKNPQAKQAFQLVNEAYNVLINFEQRRWYDFKLKYPSTTGMRPQNKTRSTAYESYYRAYTRYQQAREEKEDFVKYTKTLLDKILFYFLVVSGVLAVIFGTIQLIFDKWEGINSLSGLIFGIWFLFFLFYGWNLIGRK
ncbi:MAG: J domain-containing protein [Bacteroidales bacterium]